jgi:hypothetical protein
LLRSVDARSLSARKLLVRGGIDMMAKILLPGEVSVFDPGQLPDDIQLLKKSYSVQLPKEFGEKAFVLEDILALPASDVGLRKLIRYDIQPQVLESKIIGDKLVIRGVSQLTILYLGTDGELHHSVRFQQILRCIRHSNHRRRDFPKGRLFRL